MDSAIKIGGQVADGDRVVKVWQEWSSIVKKSNLVKSCQTLLNTAKIMMHSQGWLSIVKYRQTMLKELEMKVKEKTIQELEELDPSEVLRVYDLILFLKKKLPKSKRAGKVLPYMRVRDALKKCRGSLSEDILAGREERA